MSMVSLIPVPFEEALSPTPLRAQVYPLLACVQCMFVCLVVLMCLLYVTCTFLVNVIVFALSGTTCSQRHPHYACRLL